jgi:hypothetical protein
MLISFYHQYKKVILLCLGAVLVSCLGVIIIFSGIFLGLSNKNATLEIDIDGNKRAFEGEVIPNMTVFEALQASAVAGNISLNYVMEDGDLVIKQIDGYRGPIELITFYLNSNRVRTEEIHTMIVRPGDTISIKIQQ